MIYTPNRLRRGRPSPSWAMRKAKRQPLWIVLIAAIPLGVWGVGVTFFLNIAGG